MKKRHLAIVGFLLGLSGCTDTPDSVCREYRNAINEAIDAMMFITDEPSAKRMTVRILKPMTERFRAIDFKMRIVRSNRTKPEFAEEVLTSDGVQMYITELEVNQQRYSLELTRLCQVFAKLEEAEVNEGDAAKNNPALKALVLEKSDILSPLEEQLTSPKLYAEMSNIPLWKLKEQEKLMKVFNDKRKVFKPRDPVRLTN
jgi:hypothetical protein